MHLGKTVFVGSALAALLLAAVSTSAQQPRPGKAPGRLTPEQFKKFDKNGDGQLDAGERAAARAEVGKTGTRPAPTAEDSAGKASLGIKPLTEMSAQDRYKGEDGGLYGGGSNVPPGAHLAAAEKALAQVVPRDAQGKPSSDGKVALLAIGMSNTTQEFTTFKAAADADPAKSPQLVLVDGAQGGQGAEEWAEVRVGTVWARVDERIREAGVTPQQVQVVWLKQAVHFPLPDATENARALQKYLVTIINRAQSKFPNLRVIYLSSRTYGGFSPRHGEPESFETALSVRWVIQDQIAGKAELNYDPARGEVKAPLLLWGPYLWADGSTPRKSDGLTWTRADFIVDGTHPSNPGREKVKNVLLNFFKTDPTAKVWFCR